MSRKIMGVTVGTPTSIARIADDITPGITEYVDEKIQGLRAETEKHVDDINNELGMLCEREDARDEALAVTGNALIGEKIGNPIVFDDLSPLQNVMRISVESKNLVPTTYNQNYSSNTATIRGVTLTTNDDGSITMNGKFDETGDMSFFLVSSTTKPFVLQKGTYIGSTGQSFASLSFMKLGGGYSGFGTPITFFEETKFQYLYISMQKSSITGKTFNGETLYPMLMRGTVCDEYVQPIAAGTPVTLEPSFRDQSTYTAVGETFVWDYELPSNGDQIETAYDDTGRVVFRAEYNKDINKAFAELKKALYEKGILT